MFSDITNLFNNIKDVALTHNLELYLCNDYLFYELFNNKKYLNHSRLDFVLTNNNLSNDTLYNLLINKIVINEELINSNETYSFMSNGIQVSIYKTELVFAPFVFVSGFIFKDIINNSLISIHDGFRDDIINIDSVLPVSFESFLLELCNFENFNIKNNIEITEFSLINILKSRFPENAFYFLRDKNPELLKLKILELISYINHPVDEDFNLNDIISDEKISNIKLYNDFYLLSYDNTETEELLNNRILQIIKVIFDNPVISFSKSFIKPNDSVNAMSINCPYGDCLECDPLKCNPQCCCCDSTDIVSVASVRCHKKVIISCNEDGTGPLQGETFDIGCSTCQQTCEGILGIGGGSYCQGWESSGALDGWWNIPSVHWPCACDCKSTTDQNNCNLTCVTCGDLFCESDANITGHDCFYNISLTPSSGCCGNTKTQEMVFVVDWYNPENSNFQYDIIRTIVNNASFLAFNIRFGLVIFNDNSTGVDDHGVKYAIPLTTKDLFLNLLSTFPTSLTGDVIDYSGSETTCSTQWYAMLRSINETSWTADTRSVVGISSYASNYLIDLTGVDDSYCNGSINEFNLGPCFERVVQEGRNNNIRVDLFYNQTAQSGNGFGIASQQIINEGALRVRSCAGLYSVRYNDLGEFSYFIESSLGSGCADRDATGYSSSCDCVNNTPIPVVRDLPECRCESGDLNCYNNLPSYCLDIPINKFYAGQTQTCGLTTALFVCGSTVLIQPVTSNLVCCSDLTDEFGIGCSCGEPCDSSPCCGPECWSCNDFDSSLWGTTQGKRIITDIIWCDCWDKKAGIDSLTPNCTDCCCPDGTTPGDPNFPCSRLNDLDPACVGQESICRELLAQSKCCACAFENLQDCCNCCLDFPDGNCGNSIRHCFPDVKQRTENFINNCLNSDGSNGNNGGGAGGGGSDENTTPPSSTWKPFNLVCLKDRCIVSDIDASKSLDDQCSQNDSGCGYIKHPSSVILNNGIGLIAYEVNNEIKIQQFKTSVPSKILPNKEFSFGRLEHKNKWRTALGCSLVKMYYYDDISTGLLSGSNSLDINDLTTWKDAICFKNGPLEKQVFPIYSPAYAEDSIGKYIQFLVPLDFVLIKEFVSSDDIYNIKFFIIDIEDSNLIGDLIDTSSSGKGFVLKGRKEVDDLLMLPSHIYNGVKAPVAFPSISSPFNYYNSLENSHFVYVTYQAFEDNAWRVYLRQIRLSEYSKQEQTDNAFSQSNIVPISNLNINELMLRVICVSDDCTSLNDKFLLKRNVVLQIFTTDGLEVFNNPQLSGNWGSLCNGYPSNTFEKNKVFIKFSHSVVSDVCPDSEYFNTIFYNWITGQEFFSPPYSVSSESLFDVLTINNDTHVSLGEFLEPISVNGIKIYNSYVSSIYYEYSSDSNWSVISNSSFDILNKYKGLDIAEPILLSYSDNKNYLKPVVKFNTKNDCFIIMEEVSDDSINIKIIGSNYPASNLPIGTINPKLIDNNFDYFFSSNDFVYSYIIANTRMNTKPDMFIDYNDVIHTCWASNRDNTWEIYYANSLDNFNNVRITKYNSRSLNPKIIGDNRGRIYITWQDDRFGNNEVMLAYYNDNRVLSLYEQDAYLATIRNDNYNHYLDTVPVKLVNENSYTICVNNIIVDFYEDRVLENKIGSISSNEFSFCFDYEKTSQSKTESFDSFVYFDLQSFSGYDILTSSEFDSGLIASYIDNININFDLVDASNSVYISFKASDIENNTDTTWTDWVQIANGVNYYDILYSDKINGKYKQFRLKLNYSSTSPIINSIDITSIIKNVICIEANSDIDIHLNINPDIRIDSLGDSQAKAFVSSLFQKNNVYFTSVKIIDENGNIIQMPLQRSSVSCFSCNTKTTWANETCAIEFNINNEDTVSKNFNFNINVYTDIQRKNLLQSYVLEYNSPDLAISSVDGQSAITNWSPKGLYIHSNRQHSVFVYPSINHSSFVCGIKYYIDILVCNSLANEAKCSAYENYKSFSWVCDCNSVRVQEDSTNIKDLIRWKSSAFGYVDTRITETNYNNLNPSINIRSNGNGVIVYESIRESGSEVYSSVFSVFPSTNSYASGVESITSEDSLIFRSDIPICENDSDYSCNEDFICNSCFNEKGQIIKSPIKGKNINFNIDQFDNLFLTGETDLYSCSFADKNQKNHAFVHTCGADAIDLFKEYQKTVSEKLCAYENILNKTLLNDNIYNKAVVKNDYIKYKISFNNVILPVVDSCVIGLEVILSKNAVGYRIRNTGDNWSNWIAIDSEIQNDIIIIDNWQLTQGNGIKNIEIQSVSNAGVNSSFIISLIADYYNYSYKINLYNPVSSTVLPPNVPDITNASIWTKDNLLSKYNDTFVASLRRENKNDYVFVEIIPDQSFVHSILELSNSDRFIYYDFISQGENSQYGLIATLYQSTEGIYVYRGVIQIGEEDRVFNKDGLAYIIPYLTNCARSSSNTVYDYFNKDIYNVAVTKNIRQQNNVFQRNDIGEINYKLNIRESEDPYLIFVSND